MGARETTWTIPRVSDRFPCPLRFRESASLSRSCCPLPANAARATPMVSLGADIFPQTRMAFLDSVYCTGVAQAPRLMSFKSS